MTPQKQKQFSQIARRWAIKGHPEFAHDLARMTLQPRMGGLTPPIVIVASTSGVGRGELVCADCPNGALVPITSTQ